MQVASGCLLNLGDGEVLGEGGGGDGRGRVDSEGGEDLNSFLLADLGVLIAIDGSNLEDAAILVSPLVHLRDKVD